MNTFKIGTREIGPHTPPLVIVEIGINHSGDLKIAKQMVDAAFESGAEVIKHQTHIIEDEMSAAAKKVIPGNSKQSIYDIMSQCALSEADEIELKNYVDSKGMIFISTPFSRAAANRLQKMGVEAYKIGSGECNNYPLLKHIASFGKPIILSTGMNTIESVKKAVDIFNDFKIPFALLHTTNIYPTPPHLVRLGAMVELQENFPNVPVGLSDHTINNFACIGAMALGACLVERHFTDTMDRQGPDIVCSMDPKALKELIDAAYFLQLERGGKKGPVAEEQATIDFAYATVVTIKNIKSGEKFTKENIWVKRPGTGEIKAEHYESLLGKVANRDISEDTHVSFRDIETL